MNSAKHIYHFSARRVDDNKEYTADGIYDTNNAITSIIQYQFAKERISHKFFSTTDGVVFTSFNKLDTVCNAEAMKDEGEVVKIRRYPTEIPGSFISSGAKTTQDIDKEIGLLQGQIDRLLDQRAEFA